jgi:GTPase Era involved in 16S rRNA processing
LLRLQVILVLNKVDLVEPKERLLDVSDKLHQEADKHLPQRVG